MNRARSQFIFVFLLAISLLGVGCGVANISGSTVSDASMFTGGQTWKGKRSPAVIPWDKVEKYEYADHVKARNGRLKVNPELRFIKEGTLLHAFADGSPNAFADGSVYLWVAVVQKGLVEFRWGPELSMPPGVPMGGSDGKKKPKYGHATLTGWAPAVSGGEILFFDDVITITNDSGRINRFFPDSESEHQAFCLSVFSIEGLTGQDLTDVWYDWVAVATQKAQETDYGRYAKKNGCKDYLRNQAFSL